MITSNLKILWFYESINKFQISCTGTCSYITQYFSNYIDIILVPKNGIKGEKYNIGLFPKFSISKIKTKEILGQMKVSNLSEEQITNPRNLLQEQNINLTECFSFHKST